MGTGFNRDRLVNDVTLDTCCRSQAHLKPTYLANHTTIDDHIIGQALALDGGAFANCQKMCTNVAFDIAFDIDVACGFDVAGDLKISGQYTDAGGLAFGAEGVALGVLGGLSSFLGPLLPYSLSAAGAPFLGPGSFILLLENISGCLDVFQSG